MKKVYMLFAVLAAFCYSNTVNAGTKNLYKQDFESTSDPAAAGWASPNLAAGMSIQGDEYGNYFVFNVGGNNGRNCYTLWGSDIYTDQLPDGKYHMEFEWTYSANANNQYSTEVTVVSDEAIAVNNGSYVGKEGSQWLFDIRQLDADCNFAINNDDTNTMIVEVGRWYVISLEVDVNTRTVEWSIMDTSRQTTFAEGIRDIPEGTSMLATGINNLNSRYYSECRYDNIKVQVITDYDIANKPTVALTGVDGIERTYTISFDEAEELHLKGTDGQEQTVYYMDCNGMYPYTTSTSGQLEAWTVSGTAESEHVFTDVECIMISLPAATATISAVDEGYSKTYTLTVSNAEIPTQPTLFLEYTFTDENGNVIIHQEDKFSGEKVAVNVKGVLTVNTIAPGFTSATTTVENNREYEIKDDIDFQHITGDAYIEKGFTPMDDLDTDATSGESNWTGRKRMYYSIDTGEVDEEGKAIVETYVVYGPSSQGYEPISRLRRMQSTVDSIAAYTMFAPVYGWYQNVGGVSGSDWNEANATTNYKVYPGIGLLHSGVIGDDEDFKPASMADLSYAPIRVNNTTLGVYGYDEDAFMVVYKIDNYGGGSVHPVFPVGTSPADALSQYKAMHLGGVVEVHSGIETFQLYRVDTAVARVVVLTEKGGTGIEEIRTDKVTFNPNAPVYNLNGVRMNGTLLPGVYVKQGKKFVVK